MAGHFSSLIGQPAAPGDRIPVAILTGFLGSGKTTLLNRLLHQPDLRGAAVIVNEFGDVGIDHDLIAPTTQDIVLLPNGCVCCAVRGDLVRALTGLARDAQERGQPLRQVLIETSGLAEPEPILRTLMGEPAVRARYFLAGVACTVDAKLGMGTLDRHPEARKQAAIADHLFFTKTDLLPAHEWQALRDRVGSFNPGAKCHDDPAGYPAALQAMFEDPPSGFEIPESPSYAPVATSSSGAAREVHLEGITSFALVRDEPLPREGFYAWMDMVTAMRGDDLLRVKGIVCIAEEPDRPLVIHGVQHLFHPPEWLPAWPGPDRRTRIVFITRGLDRDAMDETLNVFTRRRRTSLSRTSETT